MNGLIETSDANQPIAWYGTSMTGVQFLAALRGIERREMVALPLYAMPQSDSSENERQKAVVDFLHVKISEFVSTKNSAFKEEWYVSERELAQSVLEEFACFIGEDAAKRERRRLYEELKKEFDGEY